MSAVPPYFTNPQQKNHSSAVAAKHASVTGGQERPGEQQHSPQGYKAHNPPLSVSSASSETLMLSSSMSSKRPVEQILGGYAIGETIGRGSFGKVKRGRHLATNELVAIKILNYQKLKAAKMDKKIFREIKILRLFSHPNICRLYEVIHTPSDIYLIMEHVEGGELYDYIVQQGSVKEVEARYIFQQLVCALEYCHHFRVVHRDLKPENILLGPGLQVKLIDFGLSNIMQDGLFLATSCGSANYAAPEVISGKLYCGPEVDVWSCGVILYALMCGCLPFDEDTAPALFSKIKKGKYEIPGNMPKPTANLITHLLCVDPLKRLTIPQIRDNDWFNVKLPARLSYAASIACVGEGSHRIQSKVVSEVSRRLNCREKEVWLQLDGRVGPGYTAYHILVDAQQRRSIATEFRQLLTGGVDTFAHHHHHQQQQQQQQQQSHPHSTSSSTNQVVHTPPHSAVQSSDTGYQHQHRTAVAFPGSEDPKTAEHSSGMNSASQSFHNSLSAVAPPLPVQYAAATRALHLGMMLSQSPAMEVLLDRHNAAATKDAYNKCSFMPASVTELGGWANSQPQESSSMGTNTSLRGSFRDVDPHRLYQDRRASLSGGGRGGAAVGGGGASLASSVPNGNGKYLFGSFPMGGPGASSGIYVRREGSISGAESVPERSRDAVSPRSSLHRTHDPNRGDGKSTGGPVVGSVASAGMAYTAKEHQFFADHNVGWRLGIMTDRTSADVLSAVYRVLRQAEMQWKVLSPFQLLARTTEATWKVLGLEIDEDVLLLQEMEAEQRRREREIAEQQRYDGRCPASCTPLEEYESLHDNVGSLPEWQNNNSVLPDTYESEEGRSTHAKSCCSNDMISAQQRNAGEMHSQRPFYYRGGATSLGDGERERGDSPHARVASSSQPPFSTSSAAAEDAMTRLSGRTPHQYHHQHPSYRQVSHRPRPESRENSVPPPSSSTPMKQSQPSLLGNMSNVGAASFPSEDVSPAPFSSLANANPSSSTPSRRPRREPTTATNMTNMAASWTHQQPRESCANSSEGTGRGRSVETGLLTPMRDSAKISPKSATLLPTSMMTKTAAGPLLPPPLISTPMQPQSIHAENLTEKRNTSSSTTTKNDDFVQLSPILFSVPELNALPRQTDPTMLHALPQPLAIQQERPRRNPPEEVQVKIHIFRIHEKHDQGYIVDWSVQKNFISGMDVVHRLSKELIDATK